MWITPDPDGRALRFLDGGLVRCLAPDACTDEQCAKARKRTYFDEHVYKKLLTNPDSVLPTEYRDTVTTCYGCMHTRFVYEVRRCKVCTYFLCRECMHEDGDVCQQCVTLPNPHGLQKQDLLPVSAQLAGVNRLQWMYVGGVAVQIEFTKKIGAGDIGVIFHAVVDGVPAVCKMVLEGPETPALVPTNPLWELHVNTDMAEAGVKDDRYVGRMVAAGVLSASDDTDDLVTPYLGIVCTVHVPRGVASLEDVVKKNKNSLSLVRIKRFLTAVIDAFFYVRSCGIRHTDMYAGNFIVAPHDDRPHIFDFGYACSLSDESPSAMWATVHSWMGDNTPEQQDIGQLEFALWVIARETGIKRAHPEVYARLKSECTRVRREPLGPAAIAGLEDFRRYLDTISVVPRRRKRALSDDDDDDAHTAKAPRVAARSEDHDVITYARVPGARYTWAILCNGRRIGYTRQSGNIQKTRIALHVIG